jgi:aerobic carbon-monoxide dehydrogenase medium subunit
MIPAAFEYARPASLDEALRLLRDREGEAKVLAGGFSLIPLLRFRLADPGLLVDIGGVDGLAYIRAEAGEIRVGSRTTHHALETSELIERTSGLWADAAGGIGDPQVRNWGTIGGSIAHADPASDWPAVLLASRGSIVVRSLEGERVIPAREFFIDTFVCAIETTEILVEVRFPVPPPRSGGAYEKLERKSGDFATAGAAVQVTLGTDGTVASAGVALSAVAQTCIPVMAAESAIVGARPGPDAEAALRDACASTANPVKDAHGPVEYKRAMAGEMAVRAFRRALARAAV